MNFREFLNEKKITILLQLLFNLLIIYVGLLQRQHIVSIINYLMLIDIMFVVYFISYYIRISKIINNLESTEANLDQKFLIKEVQEKLSHEEDLIFNVIERISKHQYQEVKNYRHLLEDEKRNKTMWVHELKQPLAVLNADDISDFERKKAVAKINKNLDRILYYERIENIGSDLAYTEENLQLIINELLRSFSYELIELDAKITMNIPKNQAIITDKFWLLFVLEQIITNAIKYKPDGKLSIIITSEIIEDKLRLTICDNGIGIPQNDLKNIFDMGYRGSNAKDKKYASGYGLYYTKQVIEKLNAKIDIENNEEKGITVYIDFVL